MLVAKPQVLYCFQGDSEDKHCDSHCNPQFPRKRQQKYMPFQIMQIRFSDYDTRPEIRNENFKGGGGAIHTQIKIHISLDI
jgi:uncharacterized protein YjaZ